MLYSRVDIVEGTNNKIRKILYSLVVVIWTYRISGLDMYTYLYPIAQVLHGQDETSDLKKIEEAIG